jgi:hypothetical protein
MLILVQVCDDPVYAKLIQSEFYSLQKEYDKVLQVIEEAFALAPEDPVVLHHRGTSSLPSNVCSAHQSVQLTRTVSWSLTAKNRPRHTRKKLNCTKRS